MRIYCCPDLSYSHVILSSLVGIKSEMLARPPKHAMAKVFKSDGGGGLTLAPARPVGGSETEFLFSVFGVSKQNFWKSCFETPKLASILLVGNRISAKKSRARTPGGSETEFLFWSTPPHRPT